MINQRTSVKEVVICDDDDDILNFLCVLTSTAGFLPLKAHGMYEVIPFVRNYHPRVLLLDIRMPDHDGFEVAEILRRNDIKIPIIFMTAHDNTFCRIYSPLVGAVGFFTKPIDSDALIERVTEIVGASTPTA
jgi:DNA-binding response OmpR family regulator